MKLRSNRDGSKWIEITQALLLWRNYDSTRFFAPKAGIKNGFKLMKNCRFRIYRGYHQISWQIRLPFFLWERTNTDWKFGTNRIYLWWHEARVKPL